MNKSTRVTAFDLFPYLLIHPMSPMIESLRQTEVYAIFTSPTINGGLTMENKIRVHPEQLRKMLENSFWKKMYESNPDKFIVSEEPPKEEDDG